MPRKSAHHREGAYDAIAEMLFNELHHDRFLLEYDSPRAGGFEPLRFVPKGKIVVLGLISTKRARVESIDELRLRIEEGETLLEFGCGTGRLADLMPHAVHYEGLDWSEEVITLARSRRPESVFRCGSVADLTPHDWVVASGPFNYSKGWTKDETAGVVAAMWGASRRGIALTVLRVPADGRLHYDSGEMISFLAGCDWAHLELDQSYLPNDMCLRAWREL